MRRPSKPSRRPRAVIRAAGRGLLAWLAGGWSRAAFAESTNALSLPPPALPDLGASLLRLFGALAVVLAVFLGAVWLFRNWQRLVVQRGRAPKLNVLEVRSLGGRHALYVIGFQQERFLIATSPSGVSLLSHLQDETQPAPAAAAAPPATFAQAFTQVLKGK